MQILLKKTWKAEKKRWSIKEVDLIINDNQRERENRTVAILVKQAESLLELRDLVVGELVCHFQFLPFKKKYKKFIWLFSFCFSLFSDFLFYERRRDMIWLCGVLCTVQFQFSLGQKRRGLNAEYVRESSSWLPRHPILRRPYRISLYF